MVRKQVYIEREQDAALKRLSKRLGVTEAELIRRGIEQVTSEDDEKEAERGEAWKRLEAVMEQRAKMKVPQVERTWTRDELYDD
ncbi:MAG: ribbon-helix-helix domain-containing protein [Dehalococcoidia bacterium]|nr:ribbon-helix-helix domain-containing protein [Dehalococcoidia bacterium]